MNFNKNLIIYVISLILIAASVSMAEYTEFRITDGNQCDATFSLSDQCQNICGSFGKIASKNSLDTFAVTLYNDPECKTILPPTPVDVTCKPNNQTISVLTYQVTCFDTKSDSTSEDSSSTTLVACFSSILAFVIVGLLL